MPLYFARRNNTIEICNLPIEIRHWYFYKDLADTFFTLGSFIDSKKLKNN